MNALSLTALMAVGAAPAPPGSPAAYPQTTPYTAPTAAVGGWNAPQPGYLPARNAPGAPQYASAPGAQAHAVPPGAQYAPSPAQAPSMTELYTNSPRGLFKSDRAFEGFVDPISNPVLSKDPRSSTYARFLFINNNIPAAHPIGGGNIQVYGLQLNLALNERLTIIADKDGGARIAPRNGPSTSGYLNLAAGLKYTFWRDEETQTLAAAGLMYEIPSGEASVQQNQGSGSLIPFLAYGKEFRQHWHYTHTFGFSFPLQAASGSSFFYNNLHIDRQFFGWLSPLAELNWFWYTSGGNRLPTAFGEGDGLINFGTRGQAGAHLVTAAFGAKAIVCRNLTVGAAFEVPLSNRRDILNQRFILQATARY